MNTGHSACHHAEQNRREQYDYRILILCFGNIPTVPGAITCPAPSTAEGLHNSGPAINESKTPKQTTAVYLHYFTTYYLLTITYH